MTDTVDYSITSLPKSTLKLNNISNSSSTEHLSPSECDGDMLGYDLYSSALADILSEPTMQPPICVGLYAQWGSGKSFLLKKLEGMSLTTC